MQSMQAFPDSPGQYFWASLAQLVQDPGVGDGVGDGVGVGGVGVGVGVGVGDGDGGFAPGASMR